jgi:hypothetical protein
MALPSEEFAGLLRPIIDQVERIHRFVRLTGSIDWDEDAYGQVRLLVQELTAWENCQVHFAPEPRRGSLKDWEAHNRRWLELYEAANQPDGHSRLDSKETQHTWLRCDEIPEDRGSVEVAYAWIPKRSRHSTLLTVSILGTRTFPEREDVVRLLRLAARVIAGTRTGTEIFTPFGGHFRERYELYLDLQKEAAEHLAGDLVASHQCRSLALLDRIKAVPTGGERAEAFKNLVADIFDWVFAPNLTRLRTEVELHGGRKRIDIVYQNRAQSGLFHDLPARYLIPCPYVIVECKNYREDPKNPEIDQLLGRFGDGRGQFGFLVCNQIDDRIQTLQRCREATRDRRGWIIMLDFDDLIAFLNAKTLAQLTNKENLVWDLLDNHFRLLAF